MKAKEMCNFKVFCTSEVSMRKLIDDLRDNKGLNFYFGTSNYYPSFLGTTYILCRKGVLAHTTTKRLDYAPELPALAEPNIVPRNLNEAHKLQGSIWKKDGDEEDYMFCQIVYNRFTLINLSRGNSDHQDPCSINLSRGNSDHQDPCSINSTLGIAAYFSYLLEGYTYVRESL